MSVLPSIHHQEHLYHRNQAPEEPSPPCMPAFQAFWHGGEPRARSRLIAVPAPSGNPPLAVAYPAPPGREEDGGKAFPCVLRRWRLQVK